MLYTYPMNWQDMYEAALERIRQLNKEVDTLGTMLRAYLPVLSIDNSAKDPNEKR